MVPLENHIDLPLPNTSVPLVQLWIPEQLHACPVAQNQSLTFHALQCMLIDLDVHNPTTAAFLALPQGLERDDALKVHQYRAAAKHTTLI